MAITELIRFLNARWDEQEAEVTAVLAEEQRYYSVSEGFTVRYDWAVSTEHSSGGYGLHTCRGAPSPQDTLADIAAKRQVLQLLIDEPHLVAEDCWYTCSAATKEREGGTCCDDQRRGQPCDCGRDRRLETAVRLLAAPYRDHPDCPVDTDAGVDN